MKTIKTTIILSLLLSSACLTNCRKEVVIKEEIIAKPEEVFLESICGGSPNSSFKYKFVRKVGQIGAIVLASPLNSIGEKYYYIKFTSDDKVGYFIPCNFPKEYKVEGLNIIVSANLYYLVCKSKEQCPNGIFADSEILSIEKQ